MNNVRQAAAATVLVALLVTSGCVSFLSGNDALAFEANRGTVSQTALDGAGYEHARTTKPTVNRTFEIAGQSREVAVTNHLTEYQKTISLPLLGDQKAAAFVVFTTPQVAIAGQTFNPVGEMSNRELLGEMQSQYDSIQIGERVDRRSIRTLETDAEVETYAGQAGLSGVNLDVQIQITKVKHDGDFLIAIGVYPNKLPDEGENVRALIRSLDHGE